MTDKLGISYSSFFLLYILFTVYFFCCCVIAGRWLLCVYISIVIYRLAVYIFKYTRLFIPSPVKKKYGSEVNTYIFTRGYV